jgi:hypothetical protein
MQSFLVYEDLCQDTSLLAFEGLLSNIYSRFVCFPLLTDRRQLFVIIFLAVGLCWYYTLGWVAIYTRG